MFRASILLAVAMIAAPAFAADADEKPADALKRELPKFTCSSTFAVALSSLAEQAGLNIQPDWPGLESAGAPKTAKVSLQLPRIKAGQALEMILAKAAAPGKPLGWYIDGKALRVTTQLRAINRGATDSRAESAVRSASPTGFAHTQPASGPADVPLRISGKHEIVFNDAKLDDVLRFFRDAIDTNFAINYRALEQSGIKPETVVTIHVADVTLARALDMVLDQVSGDKGRLDRAYWVLDGGVITVSTGMALNAELRTRVYDVSDLLVFAPDFEAPRVNLNAGGNTNSTNGGLFDTNSSRNENDRATREGAATVRRRTQESLEQSIKDSIGEDMWQPVGKGSIHLIRGQMVISQTLLGFKLLDDARRGIPIRR